MFGFGDNDWGVLGLGHENEVKEVEIIPELCDKSVKEFFHGYKFVLCLTSDNKIVSWGKNDHCQLGNGHRSGFKTSKPELIEYFYDKTIMQVCCNENYSSVLTSDGNVYLWGEYDEEIFKHPFECEFVEEIKSIHCSINRTLCLTKSENVHYWRYKRRRSINTIHNVKKVGSAFDDTYLISNDSIYIINEEFGFVVEKMKNKFNFGLNFNAISVYGSNCVIYNHNCVYELYQEEFFITKYKTPFDYYCDEQKVTQNTIELNVNRVVPNSFLSSVLPEFPGIFPGVPGNGT